MTILPKKTLQELLIKCWMTHDGMWFYHCLQECGIDTANKLNKAAIKSLAPLEIDRVRKAYQLGPVENFADVKKLIDSAFEVLKGDFMQFRYSFPSENVMRWEMDQCFAYEGMKRFGVADTYQCGVLYRVCCWIEHAGVRFTVNPPVEGCLMHINGKCEGEIRFSL
ncbi:MAG: DUF6125 family protein [Thermodesulfobacteriota bacterium]